MILLTTTQAIEIVQRLIVVGIDEEKTHRRVLFRSNKSNELFLYILREMNGKERVHGMVQLQGDEPKRWRAMDLPPDHEDGSISVAADALQ